ncbi:MAG: T9SS type A sorting domain-containing protein, partial [Saprospiraceae bacterium]
PIACGNTIGPNTFTGNTTNTRNVIMNSFGLVKNTNTGESFCTIQSAINAPNTMNGHTITVAAGTYAENIIVNKSLTILGPNAAVDGCGIRVVPEAIVVPATAGISTNEIFHVAASNVTIKGFTINGDNTSITSGFTSTNGADIDAAEGVTVYETGVNNLTVKNNIFKNLSYFGVTLYDYPAGVPSTGHVISNNKFQDLGTYDAGSGINFWGGGVLLYNNQYAAVTDNCMNNVRIGVQTGNFFGSNPGTSSYQIITNNLIQTRRLGIFHNLFYSSASPFTLSGNTITGLLNVNETKWDGISLASMQNTASTSINNNINGSAISYPATGISVWNCQVAPLISGGTISGVSLGINVNNFEGYSSNADPTIATIDGVTVTGASVAGIKVNDNPLNTNGATVAAEIKNSTITGGVGAAGILVSGSDASANIHNNSSTITGALIGVDVNGGTATLYRNNIIANGTGIRVKNGGKLNPTLENFIKNNNADGIKIEATAGAIGNINNNDLSGNTSYAINNLSVPTINATCNWYGSNVQATVASKIFGAVTYIPYLSNGTDAGGDPTNGFQPSAPCSVCNVSLVSIVVGNTSIFCNGIKLTANRTLTRNTDYNGPNSYEWYTPGNLLFATSQSVTLGNNDADGVYTVYIIDVNGCRSLAASYTYDKQSQLGNYSVLATHEVKFGTNQNVLSGSVGVTGVGNKASFGNYDNIPFPVGSSGAFVKAAIMAFGSPVNIPNRYFSPVMVTLPPVLTNTSVPTGTNYIVTVNNWVQPVGTHFKDITINSGLTATLTDSVFQNIIVKPGARVIFSNSTVNLKTLIVNDGTGFGVHPFTQVSFTNADNIVKVSFAVEMGSYNKLNPEGKMATFYLANGNNDIENFHVLNGHYTVINANIYIPKGKLYIEKKDNTPRCFMNGLFIAENIYSDFYVNWSGNNCSNAPVPYSREDDEIIDAEDSFYVVAIPNPSSSDFNINVTSQSREPVIIRILDAMGQLRSTSTYNTNGSMLIVGSNLINGAYFAEVIQGNNRQVIKLIKIN